MSKMQPYDRTVPYNELPPLPPREELYLSEKVQDRLNLTERLLGELKGMAAYLPNQSIFINTIALREAKASSAIENIFTTDDELYKAVSFEESVDGPAKEILHYREAIWKGYNSLKENNEITVDTLISLYQIIKNTRDGIRPFNVETVIVKRGFYSLKGEVVYTPPRGRGVVEKHLEALLEFINDDEKFAINPIIKMILAHYQFESIHPFRDGNGRVGRVLCLVMLLQKKLLDYPILYLSAFIIKTKDQYYTTLNNIRGIQKWEDWVLYMLDAIIETAQYTMEKIVKISELITSTTTLLLSADPQFKKIDLSKLFEQPYIRPKNLVCPTVKSLNTAKKYLKKMADLGLLSETRIGNETVYINAPLLNILSD